MKELTVKVRLGSGEFEVYAGNMAVMRYHRSGGRMASLELLDRCFSGGEAEDATEGETAAAPLSHDEILEATWVAAEYLAANLVEPGLTAEDLVNAAANLSEPVLAYVMVARAMPALAGGEPGEAEEEGATDSSKIGRSPSSNSAGTTNGSGGRAGGSGA